MENSLMEGETLFADGKIEDAERFFLDHFEEDAENPEILNNLGVICHVRGNLKESEDYLLKAIGIKEDYSTALLNLANLYCTIKDWEKAVGKLEKCVSLGSQDCNIYNLLGTVYLEQGDIGKARQILSKSLEINSDQEMVKESLENIDHSVGQTNASIGGVNLPEGDLFRNTTKPVPLKDAEKYFGKRNLDIIKQNCKKILIVMDEGIGNMVMLTPTIKAIKERLPESKITILGRQPSVQLLEGWGLVERVLTDSDDEEYDIGFLSVWSNSYEHGFKEKIDSQCKIVFKVEVDNVDTHESMHHLKIAEFFGFEGERPGPLCISKEVDLQLPLDKKIVALSDTAQENGAWERKRWPYYKELSRQLIDNGYAVVLIGGNEESRRFNKSEWPSQIINCLGKFDIQETAGILRKCFMFIGNDSGPAHMAAALGIPTFVFFGATRNSKNMPLGPKVKLIHSNLDCRPCQYTERWSSCKDWICMKGMTVERVLPLIFNVKKTVPNGPNNHKQIERTEVPSRNGQYELVRRRFEKSLKEYSLPEFPRLRAYIENLVEHYPKEKPVLLPQAALNSKRNNANFIEEKKKVILFLSVAPRIDMAKKADALVKTGRYRAILLCAQLNTELTDSMKQFYEEIFHYSTWLELLGYLVTLCPDVIFSRPKSQIAALAVIFGNAPVIVNLYDPLTNGSTNDLLGIEAEHFCFKNAAGVVYKGPPTLIDKYVRPVCEVKAPVLDFNPFCWDRYFAPEDTPKHSYKDGFPRIVYAGGISPPEFDKKHFGNIQLLPVVDQITRQGIHFHVYFTPELGYNDGYYQEYFEHAGRNPLFHFNSPLSPDRLCREMAQCDYGWLAYHNLTSGEPGLVVKSQMEIETCMPNKLFAYLEAGIPIIVGTHYKLYTDFVREFGIGIIIEQTDLPDLSKILKSVDYGKLKSNVLKARKELSLDNNIHKLTDLMENVLSKRKPLGPIMAEEVEQDYNAKGHISERSWIKENANLVRNLQAMPIFKKIGFKMWEHPFVFIEVMKRPKCRILDIGMGHGSISSVLSQYGHQIVGVDQYEGDWGKLKIEQEKTGIKCFNGNARDLNMFNNGEFDVALLVSVIEHIPSNTIYCEKRQVIKTGKMLKEENPEKLKVLSEALRVVKTGGIVIITSDIYFDYPSDMNISWYQLLGIEGLDKNDTKDLLNIYLADNPLHKGRTASVGIILEKRTQNAHEAILRRVQIT